MNEPDQDKILQDMIATLLKLRNCCVTVRHELALEHGVHEQIIHLEYAISEANRVLREANKYHTETKQKNLQ